MNTQTNPLFPAPPVFARIQFDPAPAGDTGGGKVDPPVDQKKIDDLTDKSGPKAGDFVKVGDKLYTAKEIQALEKAQAEANTKAEKALADAAKWSERAQKVYGRKGDDSHKPDRAALKELLMAAGRTADEAEAEIAEELGAEQDSQDGGDPADKKGVKDKPQDQVPSNSWATTAWVEEKWIAAAEQAFAAVPQLKQTVEAVEKREVGDSKDDKVVKEAKETAGFIRNEIMDGIKIRAQRIVKDRIDKEGKAAFHRDPLGWFRSAMERAAADEAGASRKRYGDPNKLGLSPAIAGGRDPVVDFLEGNKDKVSNYTGKVRGDKGIEKENQDYLDAFTAAALSGIQSGRAVGV